jgi:hypothetical protein
MNPEDVAHHVCKSFDDFAARATKREAPTTRDGLRDELCKWVFSVETDVAFDGLLHILETRTRYQYQWLAGDLLLRASVPCRIDLDEFIARVLPGFDASAETVPKYLAKSFSERRVLDSLRLFRSREADAGRRAGLDAMCYWLGEHPNHA